MKDPAFCWRALRLLGAEKLEVFKDFQPPKGPAFKDLPAFLEHVVRDMAAKAKPDESKAEDEGGAAPMAE